MKFLENENQQIAYLNQTLDYEKVNTIEFSDAYKRFNALIKSTKNEVKNLDISKIEPFKFLVEDDTLKQLSKWRNRIIHNGKTLPNLFALDYIITQKVLPLIAKVLETDKQPQTEYFPPYFITPSGINILELLLKVKFDFRDFYKKDDKNNRMIISKLFLIGHLKELARASFYFDRHITGDNISYQESYYENPIARFHRFAKAEESNEFYFNTEICLSCGVKSLIIYKKVNTDFSGKKLDYYYCRCTSCDYFFSENFADPFALGLSKQRIFPLH